MLLICCAALQLWCIFQVCGFDRSLLKAVYRLGICSKGCGCLPLFAYSGCISSSCMTRIAATTSQAHAFNSGRLLQHLVAVQVVSWPCQKFNLVGLHSRQVTRSSDRLHRQLTCNMLAAYLSNFMRVLNTCVVMYSSGCSLSWHSLCTSSGLLSRSRVVLTKLHLCRGEVYSRYCSSQ